jgi:CheY-like chemotaxis protein/PAS domain-containing protein
MAALVLPRISRGLPTAMAVACGLCATVIAAGVPWWIALVPPAIAVGWFLRVVGRTTPVAALETSHPDTDALARLQQAVQLAGIGTWHWDVRHRRVEYDATCATMLGYAADEIDSSIAAWGKLVHPDDLEAARAAVDALLDGKVASYESRVRLRAADGTWRMILDRGRATAWDAEGRPTHAVGVHIDAATVEPPVPSTRGRWVIVDDDDSVRMVIETAARRAGLATASFADPRRAWAAIAEGAPVGIITDFDMPGMNGIQLAERVRAAGLGCPVLLVSGSESISLSECRTVDGLLSKPFTVASLQAWLGRHTPPQQPRA